MIPEEQKRIVREGYDKLSHVYRADDTSDSYGEYDVWINELTGRLPQHAPVLDIGCGCGLPATKLLSNHFDVTGVDLSEVQIGRARQLLPNGRFICGDIVEQVFDADSFAAIVSFYAIIHIPIAEQQELFGCMAAWLQPGGWFLGTVGHKAWTGEEEAFLGVPGGRMYWSHVDEDTYRQWLEEAGFHIHWCKFVPEGDGGHTLILAQKLSAAK